MVNLASEYLRYIKHLLKYLAKTLYYAIKYKGNLKYLFIIINDTVFADYNDRTNSQSYITIIFNKVID